MIYIYGIHFQKIYIQFGNMLLLWNTYSTFCSEPQMQSTSSYDQESAMHISHGAHICVVSVLIYLEPTPAQPGGMGSYTQCGAQRGYQFFNIAWGINKLDNGYLSDITEITRRRSTFPRKYHRHVAVSFYVGCIFHNILKKCIIGPRSLLVPTELWNILFSSKPVTRK